MAGLPWGQLITAVLVAFVVFASLKAGGGIAEAANKVTSIVGFEIVPLSIKSFAATPDSSGNMQFQISLAGDTGKAELSIYQAYEPNLYNDIDAPDLKEDAVYKLIASDSPTGAKLANVAPNGVVKQTCPQDGQSKGCQISEKYEPGSYKFLAVLRSEGSVADSRDALTGIYTKEGLELLDKPVKDCPDCNVRECKRNVLIYSLRPRGCISGVKVVYGRAYNELYPPMPPVTEPTLKSQDLESCRYPPSMLPITDSKAAEAFRLCPAEEINKLHQKAASWVFFDSACEEVGMADETVDEVKKLFSSNNGIFGIERITQQKLSDCVRKAEEAFTERGWALFLTEQDRKDYNIEGNMAYTATDMARIDAWSGFDKYIRNELPPIIRNLRATLTPNNRIEVSWDLPVGSDNVKNMRLVYVYRSFVSSSDDRFNSIPAVVPLNKASRSYTLTPKELIGQHRFTVTVESANPVADLKNFPKIVSTFQSDSGATDIGFYNNEYVELYRDLTGFEDASGEHSNVIGRKEDALSNDKLIIGKTQNSLLFQAEADAINEGKLNDETCKLYIDEEGRDRFRSQREGTACTEKEVDVLFTKVVEKYANVKGLPVVDGVQKAVSDLLKPECAVEQKLLDDSRYKDTGIKQACEAKAKLKGELEKAEWAYLGG